MPRAKKTTSKKTEIPQPALTKAYESELSYETRVIVVILLLLFVYPIGLICMWAWMRNWPLWLKLLISLPLFLGVLAFFAGAIALGSILSHTRLQYEMQNRMQERREERLFPTVSPMMRQITPTQSNPNTY